MNATSARKGTRRFGWLPAALLLLALLIHLPTLAAPLVDRHPFRQTQTAYTARIFHEQGIDLLHPKLPILGPPWEAPFEFPLFQAVAAIIMDTGLPEDTALRLTGLSSFLVTAGLLWLLLRRQLGWSPATVGLAVFLFAPLGITWGRASLIEYTALATSIGFALSGLRWRGREGHRWLALALLLGCVATMVKITTAAFWIAPFALLAVTRDDEPESRRSWAGAAALSILPLVAGLAWTRYADGIKAASNATSWLTSSGLASWNFGTISQRQDLDAWAAVGHSAIVLAGGIALPFLAFPAVRFALAKRQLRFWTWILLTVLGPILVFFNLYRVHDYYSTAVSASVAGLVGLGIAGLPLIRTRLRAALLIGGGLLWATFWALHVSYWFRMYEPFRDPEGVLPLAAQIARETDPGQPVAIIGRDWTPEVLYYARRWGWMFRGRDFPPGTVDALIAQGYAVYRCPWLDAEDHCDRVDGQSGLLESGS